MAPYASAQGGIVNNRVTSSSGHSSAVPRSGTPRHQRRGGGSAQASACPAASDTGGHSLLARGPRGELRFRLQYHEGGLYVEREEMPCRGLHCVQSMHFRDLRQFERWCDDDPARFEHPLTHLALKRDAQALWQLGAQADA
jgi:hypothetical protein